MNDSREQPPSTTPSVDGPHPNPLPAVPEEATGGGVPGETTSGAAPPGVRLAVLISGNGTTLQNLIDRIADKRLNATIGVVVSSKATAYGLERAKAAGLPTAVVERHDFDATDAFSDKVFAACEAADVTLVCLAGWLRLLRVPPAWAGRVINIHPALLPKYGGRGMYGQHVHAAVLAAKDKASGCTVHFVDDAYDAGPVVLQTRCPVRVGDTPDTLAGRVFAAECEAYPKAIAAVAAGEVRLEGGQAVWR